MTFGLSRIVLFRMVLLKEEKTSWGDKMKKELLFTDFFSREYLTYAEARKKCVVMEKSIFKKHLRAAFGHLPLAKITTAEIERWLFSLKKRYKPSTCNRYLAVLRAIFKRAVKTKLIRKSPCEGLENLPAPQPPARALSLNQAIRLLSRLLACASPPALALALLLVTGARKSEILKARWENVDFENKVFIVPIAKSGKPRYFPLSSLALKIISRLPQINDSPWLFPGKNPAKPLGDIYRFWNKTRLSLGLDRTRIHDLRHTFASVLARKGASLYQVQTLLGHANPSTTMRYARFASRDLLACSEIVAMTLLEKTP